MAERQPEHEPNRNPEMYLAIGEITYQFTPHTGWGYMHENPEDDHLLIVTELTDEQKPAKADYLFRGVLRHAGVELDDVFEVMEEQADNWVKPADGLSPGERQAYDMAMKHKGIATFDMRKKSPKLIITPINIVKKKPSQEVVLYKEGQELQPDQVAEMMAIWDKMQVELTPRKEGEVNKLREMLGKMSTHDVMEEFHLPAPSPRLPLRWIHNEVILEDEE